MSNNMVGNVTNISKKQSIRLRGIALPNEHGSWSFLIEPLFVGSLIAPTITTIWIVLLFIGAFLIRQPLKVFLTDFFSSRNLPQTEMALKLLIVYVSVFLFGLIGFINFGKLEVLIPLLLILPLGIYQIYSDTKKQTRNLIPELTGAVAISSSVTAITLAGNWETFNAYSLWLIFIARFIPSILYVRNRLRLEKGKLHSNFVPISAHVIAFGFILILGSLELCSILTIVMFGVLTIRSIWGLSEYRKKVKAMRIGVWEVIFGTLTALSIVLGHYLKF